MILKESKSRIKSPANAEDFLVLTHGLIAYCTRSTAILSVSDRNLSFAVRTNEMV